MADRREGSVIEVQDEVPTAVFRLLAAAGLPGDDLEQVDWLLALAWLEGEEATGFAGLERCGDTLLLRSVVVDDRHRGRGIAMQLVDRLHGAASDAGYMQVYLLTLDADEYFGKRHGYQPVARQDAPAGIAASAQFSTLCPDHAQLMQRQLPRAS